MYLPHSKYSLRLLRRTARLWGVQPDYINALGRTVRIESAALIRVLEKYTETTIQGDQDLEQLAVKAKLEKFDRILAPVYVFDSEKKIITGWWPDSEKWGDPEVSIELEHTTKKPVEFLIKRDLGTIHVGERKFLKFSIELKTTWPIGYQRVYLTVSGKKAHCLVLIPPPPAKAPPQKRWGLFAPLYAIRNRRNWGCGDITDIGLLQKKIFAEGGSFFGSLPMLATDLKKGADPSPYTPLSKLFWNELYLDVDVLLKNRPEIQKLCESQEFLKEKKRLQDLPFTDHSAVAALKRPILKLLAKDFFANEAEHSETYNTYLETAPFAMAYAMFRSQGDREEFEYHLYVQFQMDQALGRLATLAHEGKTAHLYLDVPVGVSRAGFDAKHFASSFLHDFSAGAPPDMMFHNGQNWGFAPLHPRKLRDNGYEYFIHSLRQQMRYAGILRLDHVMGLQRMYVIPEGVKVSDGTYVRFHRREFFAILAIESYRARNQVVGEDLGTVPMEMRKILNRNHCLGMWVFPFEAGDKPSQSIKSAESLKLACLNTHDMIPFVGYCEGRDIKLFKELKLLTENELEGQLKERGKIVNGWLNQEKEMTFQQLSKRYMERMASGPCELLQINIEDLWGETEPQNIPGTWKEYPNWRKKLKYSTEEWLENPELNTFFERISQLREGEVL